MNRRMINKTVVGIVGPLLPSEPAAALVEAHYHHHEYLLHFELVFENTLKTVNDCAFRPDKPVKFPSPPPAFSRRHKSARAREEIRLSISAFCPEIDHQRAM